MDSDDDFSCFIFIIEKIIEFCDWNNNDILCINFKLMVILKVVRILNSNCNNDFEV